AFRVQSYALTLEPVSSAYVDRLLSTRAMQDWYADALKETLRDQPHDDEIARIGRVLDDLRTK
ncbi:MAG: glutathione S-transferase, partial [Gammaproteobacteria bacterium]|nr:glutathione S-transferase [Gammaproteobacteria bacterium]